MPETVVGINADSPTGSTDPKAVEQISYTVTNPADALEPLAGLQAVDIDNAITAVAAVRPATYRGKPFSHYDYESTAETILEVTAIYKPSSFGTSTGQAGDIEESVTTIGGRTTLTHAIARIDTQAPAGKTAPDAADIGLAINVGDGGVQGVDVAIPVLNFTISNWREKATLPSNYWSDIFGATAKVNSDTFTKSQMLPNFSAGSVLFVGANAVEDRTSGVVRVDFVFEYLPNRTSISIANMTFAAKKGHELLWLQYEDDEDATSGVRTKKAIAGYIDQVYETAALNTVLPLLT